MLYVISLSNEREEEMKQIAIDHIESFLIYEVLT